MNITLRRLAPGKKIIIILNLVLLFLAILASTTKGSFNPALLFCFAVPIWAVVSESPAVRTTALWASGLLVGTGFLIGAVGTYGELKQGHQIGESLLLAAFLLLLTLPTFAHLYYNQLDSESAGVDQCGASPSDQAHRQMIVEAARQADEATRIAEDKLPKGVCPNCKTSIPLASEECKFCKASFGPHSTWRVLPPIDV